MSIPLTIDTPRLALRQFVAGDWEALHDHYSDPECTRSRRWQPCPCSPRANGCSSPLRNLVGDIGVFLSQDRSFAEIGFTLARPAQGAGLATAAVRAAIDLVLTRTSATRVIGVTDKQNGPSVRLLERVGMRLTEERDTVFKGEPCTELVFVRSISHRT